MTGGLLSAGFRCAELLDERHKSAPPWRPGIEAVVSFTGQDRHR